MKKNEIREYSSNYKINRIVFGVEYILASSPVLAAALVSTAELQYTLTIVIVLGRSTHLNESRDPEHTPCDSNQ